MSRRPKLMRSARRPSRRRDVEFRPLGLGLEERTMPTVVVRLNEVSVTPPIAAVPYEYVELRGTPQGSLAGYYLVQFEGDLDPTTGRIGVADTAIPLAGSLLGTNGLLLIGSPSGYAPQAQATAVLHPTGQSPGFDVGAGELERGTITLALVASPTNALVANTDYDLNDDGTLELPAGASIVDAIGWSDSGTGDQVYGPMLTQPAGVPDAATRFRHDGRANTASAWFHGDLDGTAGTVGTTNYAPAPVSANFPIGGALTPGGFNRPNTNTPPVGVADSYDAAPGVTLNVPARTGVLSNDIDPDLDEILTARLRTGVPAGHTLVFSHEGLFTYTAPVGFNGTV